jgi:hypothetical protein
VTSVKGDYKQHYHLVTSLQELAIVMGDDKEQKRKRKRSKSDKKKESHEDAALSSDVDKIDCDEPLLENKLDTTDGVSSSDAESGGGIAADSGEKTSEKSKENDVSVRESEQGGDKEEVPAKRKRKRKRKKGGDSQNESSAAPEEDADINAKKMTSVDYTVFVEGIPFDCTEDEVGNFFAVNGCKDVIQMRLPRYVMPWIVVIESLFPTVFCFYEQSIVFA